MIAVKKCVFSKGFFLVSPIDLEREIKHSTKYRSPLDIHIFVTKSEFEKFADKNLLYDKYYDPKTFPPKTLEKIKGSKKLVIRKPASSYEIGSGDAGKFFHSLEEIYDYCSTF
jgi:hypothetical protein